MNKLLAGLMVLMLSACSDDPARAVYEGNRNNQDAHRTPNERAMQPAQGYDHYQRERQRLYTD